MDFLSSVILGIVEGVTEFLPVSSTGHLVLASQLLSIPKTEFLKSFEIPIQMGGITAVVFLYWKSFLNLELIKKLAVAFVPTGIIGLALYKVVKEYLLGNSYVVLWSLALGGLALILFELWYKDRVVHGDGVKEITYKQSFLVGLFQALAIIPGVSRSGATILGGLFLGVTRATIVEFSFLLAVPTLAAATGLDLLKSYSSFSLADFEFLAVGFIFSFITAVSAIRFMLKYVRNHTFIAFGIYRLVVALLFWVIVF